MEEFVIDKILSDKNKYSIVSKIDRFSESDFGKYVITWLGPPHNYMVGRLVQVRLEAGEFGSDMVLLRQYDNVLMRHENQSFYRVHEKYHNELDELFKDTDQDSTEITYTIAKGELPETGFIISSKIKDGESTPMRDIKKSLYNKIGELIEYGKV